MAQVVGYYTTLVSVRLGRAVRRRLGNVWPGGVKKVPQYNVFNMAGISKSGYFNIHSGLKYAPLLLNPITRRFFYPLLALAVSLRNSKSLSHMIGMWFEHVRWSWKHTGSSQGSPGKTLRKTIKIVFGYRVTAFFPCTLITNLA